MNKYYKIMVFCFDIYDIYDEDKVHMKGNSEVIIAEKVLKGYREIVTNRFIPERNIIDIDGLNLYDTQLDIYYTKKGITKEIQKKGYIVGNDNKFDNPEEVKSLDEIKQYLKYYDINKFPRFLQKIKSIRYQSLKNKIIINDELTENNVKKLVKVYKYGKEE